MTPLTLFARALLACSVHEHQEGHVRRIEVWATPGSFTLQDNGRGMGLDRDAYVAELMGVVVVRSAVVQLHGVGLSLVAASTPRLAIESRRGDDVWTHTFCWGVADAPPLRKPAGAQRATRITLATAPGAADADRAELLMQIELWRQSHPQLTITLH